MYMYAHARIHQCMQALGINAHGHKRTDINVLLVIHSQACFSSLFFSYPSGTHTSFRWFWQRWAVCAKVHTVPFTQTQTKERGAVRRARIRNLKNRHTCTHTRTHSHIDAQAEKRNEKGPSFKYTQTIGKEVVNVVALVVQVRIRHEGRIVTGVCRHAATLRRHLHIRSLAHLVHRHPLTHMQSSEEEMEGAEREKW